MKIGKIGEEAGKIENYILAKHFANFKGIYEQNYFSNKSLHYHNFNLRRFKLQRFLIRSFPSRIRVFEWKCHHENHHQKEKNLTRLFATKKDRQCMVFSNTHSNCRF